jgi:hypothetical protein
MDKDLRPVDDLEKKLAAIRAAGELDVGPAPDIEQMLAEIEQGYLWDEDEPSITP